MLEYEQQALKIAQETGDVEAECRAYCRLANIHRDLKQPDESVTCLENALRIAQRIGVCVCVCGCGFVCVCVCVCVCACVTSFSRVICVLPFYGTKKIARALTFENFCQVTATRSMRSNFSNVRALSTFTNTTTTALAFENVCLGAAESSPSTAFFFALATEKHPLQ
jgi:tetratricopeptide (TPR) repeat protein